MSKQRNQEILGYNNSKGMEYVRNHMEKYRLLMDTFISPNLNPLKKVGITADFLYCVIFYGAGVNDYFQYHFYKRRAIDRKQFIVGRKWHYIIKKCNGTSHQEVFDNKTKFNRIYSSFLGREWIDTEECSLDAFQEFVTKHPTSISKIKDGSGGNGIALFQPSEDFEKDFFRLKSQKVMLEELIAQHPEMAKFNPSCVNTLRIVTINDGKRIHIMNAVFRCGNGEGCTDNFHHFGLAALIDVKNGMVITPGIDKNNVQYAVHPRSKEKIVGFEIPYWKRIIQTVCEAAKVTPTVRYVGWDIAIQEDGRICIIEGNCASDPDITQMPDQIGKWPLYKKILSQLE